MKKKVLFEDRSAKNENDNILDDLNKEREKVPIVFKK